MTNEAWNNVKAAQDANDAAVHATSEVERLKAYPIKGNHAEDAELLNELRAWILDEDCPMVDRIWAYNHMGTVMGLTNQPTTTEATVREFTEGCQEETPGLGPVEFLEQEMLQHELSTDPTPASPDTVGQDAVAIAQASKENPPKKVRRKPVRGVVAVARRMLTEGHTDIQIRTAVYQMYLDGGRDPKNAQDSAQVVLSDVKKAAKK